MAGPLCDGLGHPLAQALHDRLALALLIGPDTFLEGGKGAVQGLIALADLALLLRRDRVRNKNRRISMPPHRIDEPFKSLNKGFVFRLFLSAEGSDAGCRRNAFCIAAKNIVDLLLQLILRRKIV